MNTATAAIGEARGIEAAVRAINTHINNANVCYVGCWALCNMAINGKNNNKQTNKQNEQLRTK